MKRGLQTVGALSEIMIKVRNYMTGVKVIVNDLGRGKGMANANDQIQDEGGRCERRGKGKPEGGPPAHRGSGHLGRSGLSRIELGQGPASAR